MPALVRSRCLIALTLMLAIVARTLVAAEASDRPRGIFSEQSDVGRVGRPSAVSFDPTTMTYKISASGANMWGTDDAFGFVWQKATGDIAIAAEIAFVGTSQQANRKACLVIRESLDADAAYADVAVHGDGHTSLQFRSEKGGRTWTVQGSATAPKRVRLEKRGPYVTWSFAGADGVWIPSGCSTRLSFDGPFHVGLAMCAHDNAAFETATFSAVELGAPPAPATPRTSALEIVTLASLDRRVVYRADGKLESPHFSPEGDALYFNGGGRIRRMDLNGSRIPVFIDTGFAVRNINDHGISPDGTQLVISDLTETGKSRMYILPIAGGAPKRVDVAEPALWHGWSPDGSTLTYCAERGGNYDVYTVPLSGGPEMRLTSAPGNDNGPDYSSDGKWIYYHTNRSGKFQVWRMLADGTNQEQVTDDEYFNWFPHPSPDGKWIAILSTKVVPDTGHPPDGDYVLRLIPTAGGDVREIARFYGANGSFNVPCWSPDSTRLAYASYAPAP